MKKNIEIERNQLYKLVWSKPVVQIAKDFGISDVAVSKICKKLNIPKPGLGYWAKKQFGKRTSQTPLPPLKAGDPETYTIKGSMDANLNLTSEFIEKQKAFENRPASEVKVKQSLQNSHPLVDHSIQRLHDEHADQSKRYRGGRGCVDIWVSKERIHRALRIMDALIKALEKRGFPVSLKDHYQDNTSVEINGESISFGIVEASRQIPNPKRETDRWENRYDYIPTGKLTLRIKNHYDGQKSISDGKTQLLEDCLNKFILLLVKASAIEKIRRKAREQRHREYQERAQREREVALQKQREQEMLKQLFDNAVSWNKCKLVREYIAAVQDNSGDTADNGEKDAWVNWASERVERIEFKLLQINNPHFGEL